MSLWLDSLDKAKIRKQLPGVHEGGTTKTIFFLMSFIEDTGKFDGETQFIIWVTSEKAKGLISITTNQMGRKRDLKVLGELSG